MGKLSLRRQRTVESFSIDDLAGRLQKAGPGEAPEPIPVGRRWGRGKAMASNRGRRLCEEVLDPLDDFNVKAVGS